MTPSIRTAPTPIKTFFQVFITKSSCLGLNDCAARTACPVGRSEEHTSELQSLTNLVCRLLLQKNITPDTQEYFMRLPGHDTFRLILASRSILVEGPSDELILQAFFFKVQGRPPFYTLFPASPLPA